MISESVAAVIRARGRGVPVHGSACRMRRYQEHVQRSSRARHRLHTQGIAACESDLSDDQRLSFANTIVVRYDHGDLEVSESLC